MSAESLKPGINSLRRPIYTSKSHLTIKRPVRQEELNTFFHIVHDHPPPDRRLPFQSRSPRRKWLVWGWFVSCQEGSINACILVKIRWQLHVSTKSVLVILDNHIGLRDFFSLGERKLIWLIVFADHWIQRVWIQLGWVKGADCLTELVDYIQLGEAELAMGDRLEWRIGNITERDMIGVWCGACFGSHLSDDVFIEYPIISNC